MKTYKAYKPSNKAWIGKIPEHWIHSRLKMYSKIYSGGTPDKAISKYWENGTIPWIGSGEVNQEEITIPSTYITNEAFQKSSAKWIPKNSLVIALAGQGRTKATVAYTSIETTCNQSLAAVVVKKNHYKYLYYWLRSKYSDIRGLVGEDRDGLNLPMVGNIPIPLPPISEQKQISDFLDLKISQIDRFIANRKKQICLLKERHQNKINLTLQKGVFEHENFKQDRFYGEYPEQWELSNVRRELRNVNIEQQDGNHGELHPTSKDYAESGIPFILANHLDDYKVDLKVCKFIPESVAQKLRIGFAKTGDILLTHKGTLGRIALCNTADYPYVVLTPQVTYYRVKRTWANKYVYYLFQSTGFQEQLKLIGSGGSTRDYIGLVAQKDLKLLKPSLEEQNEIIKRLDESNQEYSELASKYEKQISLMQEYKITLISKAVTGKIDIRE